MLRIKLFLLCILISKGALSQVTIKPYEEVFYYKTGNLWIVTSPSIVDFKPQLKGVNVRIIQEGVNQFRIIPDSANIRISIENNGELIYSKAYICRLVPKPSVDVYIDDKVLDEKTGVKKTAKKLSIKIIPEDFFKDLFPMDSQYFVGEVELVLERKENEILRKVFRGDTIDLSSIGTLRAKDKIRINVKEIFRINYLKEVEKVKFNSMVFIIKLK